MYFFQSLGKICKCHLRDEDVLCPHLHLTLLVERLSAELRTQNPNNGTQWVLSQSSQQSTRIITVSCSNASSLAKIVQPAKYWPQNCWCCVAVQMAGFQLGELMGVLKRQLVLALGTVVLILGRVHEILQLSLVRELDLHQPASTVGLLVNLMQAK